MKSQSDHSIRVLHVDEPAVTASTATALTATGDSLIVETAPNAAAALELISDRPPNCVVSAYDLPEQTGVELLAGVREQVPELPFILFTDRSPDDIASEAFAAGATDCLRKGWGAEYTLLSNRIEHAIDSQQAARRAAQLEERLDRIENTTDTDDIDDTDETKDTDATDETERNGSVFGERDRRFRALVEQSTDIISIVDADGRIEYQSPSTEHVLGYESDETVGEPIFEYIHPDDRGEIADQFKRWVTQPDAVPVVQFRVRHVDGSWRWLEARGNNQLGTSDIDGYVINSRDVTEQKKREGDLQRHRDFLQDIQDVADIGGWEVDLRSDTVQWTDEVYRIHDLPPGSEVSLEDALGFYHPEDRKSIQEAFQRLRTDGEPYDKKCRIVTTTDEVRWVRTMGKPWRDETGELIGAHGAFQDVTEQTNREHELLTKSRALDEAPVGVVITDSTTDNQIVYANPEFIDICGYPPAEVIGRNCRFLQGRDTQPEPVAALRSGIGDENDVSVEVRNYRKDGTEFWNHLEISPVHDETGELVNYVGFQQDVTERIRRKQALEKRERVLHELHTSTRAFYPPDSATDISEFLVEFIERAFDFGYVSVKQFDEQRGELTPAAVSSWVTDSPNALGPVTPGPNPIWQAYQQSESTIFDGRHLPHIESPVDETVQQALVVPIGDFGVTVAFNMGSDEIDQVDVELIEVAAANAEAAFQRLRSDHARNEISTKLSAQQSTISELTSSISSLRTIHQRLANSDSQTALEQSVCEGLLGIDHVDFAWIGRPQRRETDIRPTEWAGDGQQYLDSIEISDTRLLPAQRAAAGCEQVCVSDIPSRVLDEPWAKAALSVGFKSALSVPLVHDDVLYGVLSVYSRVDDAFDQLQTDLLTDVASLAVTYSQILDHRYADSGGAYIEREFKLSGSTYPLQRLATATDSRIRFDTVAETTDETARILVTVVDGDVENVRSTAAASNSILTAEPFGDVAHQQLSLTIKKPFLASIVGKHGGRLVQSLSDQSGTRFRVSVPKNAAKRPLVASLLSRYPEVELVAQRQTTAPDVIEATTAADLLTDRQHEILTAAYHGGYYETPRRVTGEDLAESFDISSPTVYNHLQAAHRTLLEAVFESQLNITPENKGVNN